MPAQAAEGIDDDALDAAKDRLRGGARSPRYGEGFAEHGAGRDGEVGDALAGVEQEMPPGLTTARAEKRSQCRAAGVRRLGNIVAEMPDPEGALADAREAVAVADKALVEAQDAERRGTL